MQKKLCFGGAFNPIHHGHLICARAAAQAIGGAAIVLIPTGTPPHKPNDSDLASAADRLEMCRRAVDSVDGFQIDDRELRQNGPSYTIRTVRNLKSEGASEVTWLIGADMLNILPKWYEPQALLAETQFLIMARPGWSFEWDSLPKPFQALKDRVVPVPQIDISASEIRRRVRAGIAIDFLTPPAVCRYIQDHRLYQ